MNYKNLEAPRLKRCIEESYASILVPYATISGLRKDQSEESDADNRSVFQRDRDRIIHSQAFRRLMYKTQVFVNHEGDYFRTRLTHTIEVAQFARGVCKSLALNEDLAEAISLGHDLGHTPFGHAVERFFDTEMKKRELGRFFHNEQSVRVVDFLEKRKEDTKGLNLSNEVREGILKHNGTSNRSGAYPELKPFEVCSHLEGQIVNVVDTIAYICHDLDDAIISGIIYKSANLNEDFSHALDTLKDTLKQKFGIEFIYNQYKDPFFIRNIIHEFLMDLTNNTFDNIKKFNIENIEDVRRYASEGKPIVSLSKDVNGLFQVLKKFTSEYIYNSNTVARMDEKAVAVVGDLFEKFINNPILLPPNWLYRYKHIDNSLDESGIKNNETRLICDYISCMTDRFALDEHERLFNPRIKL